ncbi:MAG: dienelactone hydrolase family protein [Firmicutes bacterium]|nr:dienelactone hydrolase family protein [Bacillota bacterium]
MDEEVGVRIPANGEVLEGNLALPAHSAGLVLFAHGSGSSRWSPRNRHVAQVLQQAGLGTLLFDLLTAAEEAEDVRTARLRFDIPLLARRLLAATAWVRTDARTRHLPVGYFGASTGAAAALVAAAQRPEDVAAIVSRGGRPDLAADVLERVRAPTLLIVGGRDLAVLELNRQALAALQADSELAIVPGAGHLFEEPGALDEVARLAVGWFRRRLRTA